MRARPKIEYKDYYEAYLISAKDRSDIGHWMKDAEQEIKELKYNNSKLIRALKTISFKQLPKNAMSIVLKALRNEQL